MSYLASMYTQLTSNFSGDFYTSKVVWLTKAFTLDTDQTLCLLLQMFGEHSLNQLAIENSHLYDVCGSNLAVACLA